MNNAAVSHDGKRFWELELDDIDRLIDTNLKGTMYITQLVLKHGVWALGLSTFRLIANVRLVGMVPANSGFIVPVNGK